MFTVSEMLKRSSDKFGLKRVIYNENKYPSSLDSVVIFPFFGDLRSTFILSSIILRRVKEELKGSKYFILLSWPGCEGLFPYVDEYWTIEDEDVLDKLKNGTNNFENNSNYYSLLIKGLNEWFYEIFSPKDFYDYYNYGIKSNFFEKFKNIKVWLPNVNSSVSLGMDFARTIGNKELKVFIYPSKNVYGWHFGNVVKSNIDSDFWTYLCKSLIDQGYYPVIYKDLFCHDLSNYLDDNFCCHVWGQNANKMLAVMRSSGFVLDVFSNISRMAICARTPFLCFDERNRYNNTKDYEIDDLCGRDLYKEYVFTFFSTILTKDEHQWKVSVLDSIISKFNKIFPMLNKDNLPSSIEFSNIVPYGFVRKIKNKKLGTRFIKIKKD